MCQIDDEDNTCHINDNHYVCSKVAEDKLDETRFVILKWSLVATLWFLFFLRFFVIQGIIFVFTKLPLSYIFLNVLRHIDTPTTSLKNVALLLFVLTFPSCCSMILPNNLGIRTAET